MSFKSAQCKNCGANLHIAQNKEIAFCPFCGAKHIREEEHITNINETNYNNNIAHAEIKNANVNFKEPIENFINRYNALMKIGELQKAEQLILELENTYPEFGISYVFAASFYSSCDYDGGISMPKSNFNKINFEESKRKTKQLFETIQKNKKSLSAHINNKQEYNNIYWNVHNIEQSLDFYGDDDTVFDYLEKAETLLNTEEKNKYKSEINQMYDLINKREELNKDIDELCSICKEIKDQASKKYYEIQNKENAVQEKRASTNKRLKILGWTIFVLIYVALTAFLLYDTFWGEGGKELLFALFIIPIGVFIYDRYKKHIEKTKGSYICKNCYKHFNEPECYQSGVNYYGQPTYFTRCPYCHSSNIEKK